MKKLILLLAAVTITFNACNSDDAIPEVIPSEEDFFIGIWTQSRTTLNGQDQPIDDCVRQSMFIINPDGTFIESAYSMNADGECELDFEDPGTWESLSNNIYRIIYTSNEDDPDEDYEEDITVNDDTFFISYDNPFLYFFTKD